MAADRPPSPVTNILSRLAFAGAVAVGLGIASGALTGWGLGESNEYFRRTSEGPDWARRLGWRYQGALTITFAIPMWLAGMASIRVIRRLGADGWTAVLLLVLGAIAGGLVGGAVARGIVDELSPLLRFTTAGAAVVFVFVPTMLMLKRR